jgi:hypothetical protein
MLGCARKPAVTVEQIHETTTRAPVSLSQRVFPPRCEEIPIPDYPDVNFEKRPDRVSVRVDFTIDDDGVPKNLHALAVDPSPWDEPYVRASIEAAGRIRCEPAWSPPRPGSDDLQPRPREYKSSLIFHFLRDERKAKVAF